jgi:hypothetical protein
LNLGFPRQRFKRSGAQIPAPARRSHLKASLLILLLKVGFDFTQQFLQSSIVLSEFRLQAHVLFEQFSIHSKKPIEFLHNALFMVEDPLQQKNALPARIEL